jgi:hypothetical protein
VIHVATFNLDGLDRFKVQQPGVLETLALVIQRFDVIAVQQIHSREPNLLPQLVDRVNESGREFDYVIGPQVGRGGNEEQFAFLFDTNRVDIDRYELYTIGDPDDLLRYEPLVGWFRAKGAEPDEAFTFTLVNMHTDPQEFERETSILESVLQRVRNDQRGEDDCIALGDFQADADTVQRLAQVASVLFVVRDTPTDLRHTEQRHNILLERHATREFTGRSGVFDFPREMNLTVPAAELISSHLPVWAEFSIYEGGTPGRIATRPSDPLR